MGCLNSLFLMAFIHTCGTAAAVTLHLFVELLLYLNAFIDVAETFD